MILIKPVILVNLVILGESGDSVECSDSCEYYEFGDSDEYDYSGDCGES